MVGWAVGLLLGIYLFVTSHKPSAFSPLYPVAGHLVYIAVIALAINLAIVLVGTAIAMAIKRSITAVARRS